MKDDEAINETFSSIAGGLQNMLFSGGAQDILKMFSGNQSISNSAVTNNISGGVIENLMKKFGLDQSAASGIANKLVPNVMQNMVQKTNDPNDSSFDIQGVFSNLSGGSTSGFNMQDLLNKFKGAGLDQDGDGDTDLQDLTKMVSGDGAGILDKKKERQF
ncbi:MAG TPA: hypothetical protein VGQ04_08875 [Chitinophagaceae bacterium]|nr:hypothetical protein [Chitinophagaceae bacterium]